MKMPDENFSFLCINANILHQLFYQLVSVTNGITTKQKTGKQQKTHNPSNVLL